MDPVLLPLGETSDGIYIPKLLGKDLFPEPVKQMHGRVQVEVVPRPVKLADPLPFDPSVAAGHVPEKAAFKRTIVGAPGHLPCNGSGELVDELIQITHPGQRSKCANARLQLVLNAKINTARELTPTVYIGA